MPPVNLERFKEYLADRFLQQPVVNALNAMVGTDGKFAGQNREDVFTKRILCPHISNFFYDHVRQDIGLADEEIGRGLGAEGFDGDERIRDFCFTPARQTAHLFTKDMVIKPLRPRAWMQTEPGELPPYRACPDFAIRNPLPFSVVGEVKYFKSESPERAVTELYNASRQALFYLGTFHNAYDSALLVVADASRSHAFFKGLELLKPDLLGRFGQASGIHLLPLRLT